MTTANQPTPVGAILPEVFPMIRPACPECRDQNCTLLTTRQVAEVLGIHYKTAQTFVASGRIRGFKLQPKGRYRIRRCNLTAFEAQCRRAS